MNAKPEDKTVSGTADGSAIFAAEAASSGIAPPAMQMTNARGPATDTYAVAVRVLKIAPAWLLFISVVFVLLTLTLGWVRPGAGASGEAYFSPNDSKVAPTVPPASPSPSMPAAKPERQTAAAQVPSPAAQTANTVAQAPSAGDVSHAASAQVETAPKPATPAATQEGQSNAADNAGPKFTVQVGSHSDESSANEQTSRLRSAGFDARTVVAELPGRGKWFRVQAGSFDDRESASKVAAAIRAKGAAVQAIVVPQQ
jgi:cell division septation protein DedD